MILGHRVMLRPSTKHKSAVGRACGASRWTWNWGLRRKIDAWKIRKAALDAGVSKKDAPKVPTAVDLHRELNALKKIPKEDGGVPWMYESSKCAPQEALRDLDEAFENFFRRLKAGEKPGFPRFKARGRDPGHFRLTGTIRVKNGRVQLPRIGAVPIAPGDRKERKTRNNQKYLSDGEYGSASLTEESGKLFVSVLVDVPEAVADDTRPAVGIDVGVRELAHLSDGTVIPNPKALDREAARLRKSRLAIARKQRAADKKHGKRVKGQRREESKRLFRERKKAARLAHRVANIRKDALHKATTFLAKTYSRISVEDLHGKSMTRARKGKGRAAKAGLNRAILDSGMLRIRPLLAYKMPRYGGQLVVVPAANTTRECSKCHARNDPGSSKVYRCASCGLVIDRDENASLNIHAAASCSAALAESKDSVPASRGAAVRPKAKAGRQAAAIRESEVIAIGRKRS